MGLLQWYGFDHDIFEPPALTVMGEPAFCCPRFADYRHGFLETLCGLLDGDGKPFKLAVAITLAYPKK